MPHPHRRSQSPQRLTALRPAMNLNAKFRMGSRALIFAVSGLVLTWLVLSHSLAAFLADATPQAALWFDARQPQGLVNLADQALVTAGAAQVNAALADQASQPAEEAPVGTKGGSQKLGQYFLNLAHAFSRFETVGRNLNVSRPVAPDNQEAVRTWAETALMSDPP